MSKCALIDIDSVAPDWNSNSESSAESVQELQEEAATEHYVKVGKSKLRNDLELQIDPKYAGEKISRNDMDIQFQSEEEEFDFGSSDEEFEIVSNADSLEKQDEKIDDDQSQISYKSDDCHSNISEEDLMAKLETQEFEERQQISRISENAKEDAEKGVHVRSQMTLWDNFLDFRINTQKILDSANAMPIAKDYDRIVSDSAARSAVDGATNELWKLFDILVDIRKEIILPNQITCEYKMLKRKRQGNQLEMINSAWEDILNPMEKGFEKFRNETIEKWNNKIQLSSGAISLKKFKVINQSIISQISASMAHPEKLLKRTKLNRAGIKIIGKVNQS
jgi:protein AATF/BFR2